MPAERAALAGAALASAVLLATAAAQDVLDPWLAAAAAAAIAVSGLLFRKPLRERGPDIPADAGGGPAVADALLAHVPDPVILIDRRAVVIEANPAARTLLPTLKLRHPLSFALRDPAVLGGVEEVVRTGQLTRVEYSERVPTERAFEVQIGTLGLDGGEESPRGVMLFFRDLTSARRLERMRADFVANASHELRTPLASLLGFVETLQGPARNDQAARDRFLNIMREQARRMTRLIDDLLSLSRIELRAHLTPETPVDLLSIVKQMIDSLSPLGRERGVEIRLEADEGPLIVRGDRDELLRVVENLVENAVKYGDGGARIEVEVRRREGGQIALSVRDHGPGIAPEHLPRLTERFYRVDVTASREQGGTGLGLAIVKHIVNRHRGRLDIESELGDGATFAITLPAQAEAASGAGADRPSADPVRG